MDVARAINTRFSCRAFLGEPVPRAVVEDMLTLAARAPSGGNLQPWRVWALGGESLQGLIAQILSRVESGAMTDGEVEYHVYPPDLKEPYAGIRFRNGEQFYDVLGVDREDYAGRFQTYLDNFRLFGAPVGLVFAIDRSMQQGQWADLGMYMQSVMLLAKARGLDTVALESWSFWHRTIRTYLKIPDDLIVFCAMAIGWADTEAPVNQFRTEREPLSAFAVLRGLEEVSRQPSVDA